MLKLFKRTDPIEKFWTWFKENEKRFRNFEQDPDKYLSEMLAQGKKIAEGLAIELEPPADGLINMTVSADGNRDLFETVVNFVDKAPNIEGWNFNALRQRIPADKIKTMQLKVKGRELDPQDMKFFPTIDNDTLDIIIYVNGVTEDNYNDIAYAGLQLLDNILGEYDCVMKVHSYDFHNMPVKKEELADLLPLLDITAYVDKVHPGK